jgi:hypothetical protein
VRHLYYLAVTAGLVAKDIGKSRSNYTKVDNALNVMRERGVDFGKRIQTNPDAETLDIYRDACIIPFPWIVDATRGQYRPTMYDDKEAGLKDFAWGYRRNLWRTQDTLVEVWCESESIASVLLELTTDLGVVLLPCRGQSSKGLVWTSAQSYARQSKPVVCIYVGDFDPSGLDIGNSVRERMLRYFPRGSRPDFDFRRIAIMPEQVREYGLAGHGVNPNIKAVQRQTFYGLCDAYSLPHESVEAEALDPVILRGLVEDAIRGYVDERAWEIETRAQESERRDIWAMING